MLKTKKIMVFLKIVFGLAFILYVFIYQIWGIGGLMFAGACVLLGFKTYKKGFIELWNEEIKE